MHDKYKVFDVVVIQMMRCTICHLGSNNGNGFTTNSRITCTSKGIDQYNPLHIGIKIKKPFGSAWTFGRVDKIQKGV